jgi:magnesium chelatase family protein
MRVRPFRSPHHTISNAGLIGGGSWPRPGEVSLAHHGVLFLDELPEFDPHVTEVLRQPLEDRLVTIARAAASATFPACFTLVAARNPCPCGYWRHGGHDCTCTPGVVQRYQRRVSGPLLDRIDMHVEVPRVDHARLFDAGPAESSATVRRRVMRARAVQSERLAATGDAGVVLRSLSFRSGARPPTCNAHLRPDHIRRYCLPTPDAVDLLRTAVHRHGLSARSYHRVLKLARTIADLDESEDVRLTHVAEALQYRPTSAF